MIIPRNLGVAMAVSVLALAAATTPAAFAAPVTWNGGGSTNDWSEGGNWSTGTPPASGDDAIFDGTSIKDCTLDDDASGVAIGIMAAYTGTITQGALALTPSSYTQAGGTFIGGTADITVVTLSLNGGSFTSTSGNLAVTGTSGTPLSISGGTFSHNNGTVTQEHPMSADTWINTGGATLNNLTVNQSSGWVYLSSSVDLDGSFSCTGTGGYFTYSGYQVTVRGDFTLGGGYFDGNGATVFDGTGAQTLDFGTNSNTYFQNMTVNKASGTVAVANSDVDVNGSLDIQAGTLDLGGWTLTLGGNLTNTGTASLGLGTVVLDGTNQTISGTSTFGSLTKTVTSPDTLTLEAGMTQTVTGTLTLQGTVGGNLLSLRSSLLDMQWLIDPQGTRDLVYLDVQDSNNVNPTVIDVSGTGSTDSGNNTNWTFTTSPAGTLAFSTSAYSVGEVMPTATITVTRTGGILGAVSVEYSTSPGTALPSMDYMDVLGTLTWLDGETADKTFTVSIFDDTLTEGNETVSLMLSNPIGGATLGSPSTATLTIIDDEAPPESIMLMSPIGGETWDVGMMLTVSWSASGLSTVRIELSRDGGMIWEDIAPSAEAMMGSYTWTATGPASTTCLVRVSDTVDGIPWDESASLFTIADDAHEEDDTPTQADAQGYFAEATNYSGVSLDDDYFVISVQTGYEQLLVTLTFTDSAGDLDLRLYDSDGTTQLDSSVSTSDNEAISFEVAAAGDYYLHVDPFGAATNTYTLRWDASAGADLVITSIVPSNPNPSTAEVIDVDVTVENVGMAPAGSFEVGLFYNWGGSPPTPGDMADDTQVVSFLDAMSQTTITFTGIMNTMPETWSMYAIADNSLMVSESDETNNVVGPVAITWGGGTDTDGDGIDDNWELTYFTDLAVVNNLTDFDGPGPGAVHYSRIRGLTGM